MSNNAKQVEAKRYGVKTQTISKARGCLKSYNSTNQPKSNVLNLATCACEDIWTISIDSKKLVEIQKVTSPYIIYTVLEMDWINNENNTCTRLG